MAPWLAVLVVPAALIALGGTTLAGGVASKNANCSSGITSSGTRTADEGNDSDNGQGSDSPIVVAPPNATIIVPGPSIIVPQNRSGSPDDQPGGEPNEGPVIGRTGPISV